MVSLLDQIMMGLGGIPPSPGKIMATPPGPGTPGWDAPEVEKAGPPNPNLSKSFLEQFSRGLAGQPPSEVREDNSIGATLRRMTPQTASPAMAQQPASLPVGQTPPPSDTAVFPTGSVEVKQPVRQVKSTASQPAKLASIGSQLSSTGAPSPSPPSPGEPAVGLDPTLQKFLLQTGLNLMVPQWGNGLSQIGQAVGAGAEAVDRGQKAQAEAQLTNRKLDLEEARIAKVGQGGKAGRSAKSSSSAARLKAKTPMQEFASTLSPEGSLFFTQRLKDLNKPSDDDDAETPEAKFERIMNETKSIDRRARASRGMARSEEISDALIQNALAAGKEDMVLQSVAADPTQRALMAQRLDALKRNQAVTNAAKPAEPK